MLLHIHLIWEDCFGQDILTHLMSLDPGKAFKWGWSPTIFGEILKLSWDAAAAVGASSVDLIKSILDGMSEGSQNISNLWNDKPFGWMPRVLKNLIWNCFLAPILKFFFGAVDATVGCVGKWVIGNLGGLISALESVAFYGLELSPLVRSSIVFLRNQITEHMVCIWSKIICEIITYDL